MISYSLYLVFTHMDLISLVIILIVVGVCLWAVNTYIPMDAKIKAIMNVVVVVVMVLFILKLFFPELPHIHVGR